MHLYNLTLQPASAISTAALGHFTGGKTQEIVIARHERLELWSASPTTGRLTQLSTQPVFAQIRSLAVFRVPGGKQDHVALTCDNGALSILAYEPQQQRRFALVQHHEFARTGLRRGAAGEYVASDPRGRAVMVAGVERAKLVYVVTRDEDARVLLASPLDAGRGGSGSGGVACLGVVGVDVGYENPVFAALEVAAKGAAEVAYYELDLGLNHVVRRWSSAVPSSAGRLVALPGGSDGPSGVLVCSAGAIEWCAPGMPAERVRADIPRRKGDARPVVVVAHAVHRMRAAFFILAQGAAGDLYKVTVEYAEGTVTRLRVAYFDSLMGASTGLCILRAGFLFAAAGCDGGAHRLFQFANLGDDSDEAAAAGAAAAEVASDACFEPRELESLALVDELECAAPVVRAEVLNLAAEAVPQVYVLGGRTGAQPALRVVRRGLDVAELAESALPGRASHVFSARATGLVAVSFAGQTLVLRAGEDGAMQEDARAGLATDQPTLALYASSAAATLQATPRSLLLLQPAGAQGGGRRAEWLPPAGHRITQAALSAATQLVATDDGHVRVLDVQQGEMLERTDRLDLTATCLALAPVDRAAGQRAPRFAAVGCADGSVRIYALGAPGGALEMAAVQAVADVPCGLAMAVLGGRLHVLAGLRSGVLVRALVDEVSGEMEAVRVRFLGAHPVRLRVLEGAADADADADADSADADADAAGAADVVVALAGQPWAVHAPRRGAAVRVVPLAYDAVDDVAAFAAAEGVARAMVAVAQGALKVLALERVDIEGSQAAIPLRLTPRMMQLHEASGHFAVAEAEHRAVWDGEHVDEETGTPEVRRTEQGEGEWAALVRVVSAFDGATAHVEVLRDGWSVVSMANVRFAALPDGLVHGDDGPLEQQLPPLFLAVGCARNLRLRPRSCAAAELRLYRWVDGGCRLALVHTTELDHIPQAMLPFAGLLAVAQGRSLTMYALGRRRLLRKAQATVAPHLVTLLAPVPDAPLRLLAADVQESVALVEYDAAAQGFSVLVNDSVPRYLTCIRALDDHTVAAADKFGNLTVLRVPERGQQMLDPLDASAMVTARPQTPFLWDALCEYHVGDPVTMLESRALAPAARPVLVYATLRGALMAAVPLPARRDVELLVRLELALRETLVLPVRDHGKYRSAFVPVKGVVDGDLCESFEALGEDVRSRIAESLGRSVDEISKKLDDLRSQYTFG
ncbi:pre-mRNA-splicing factor rse1 [Coemansia erecta]|uniref:Pre-mRNA-splicing factor rse1 n=1 Tax=Coemansia erecta TaxID=147472 RepID=A0A9W7XRY1_9FUNG|nr:pre-mRNA-splicing factor rse1 [Coemansia erecta]